MVARPTSVVSSRLRSCEAGATTIAADGDRLGEAHHRGPVIVSWAEIRANAFEPGDGQNLVFHEFAHQLDMLNGAFDGTPDLRSNDLLTIRFEISDTNPLMQERYLRATAVYSIGT